MRTASRLGTPGKPLLEVVSQVLHSRELCVRAHHAVLEGSCFPSACLIACMCQAHVAEQVIGELLWHHSPFQLLHRWCRTGIELSRVTSGL